MMKKVIIIIVAILSLFCLVFVYKIVREYFSNDYIKISVFPIGIKSERTYYFIIKKDMTLVSKTGSRWTDDVNSVVFMKKVEESKEIKLTEQEFQEIENLINEIKKNPTKLTFSEKTAQGPSGMISLRYNFKSYSSRYFGNRQALSMLIDMLCEISDVEIDFTNY